MIGFKAFHSFRSLFTFPFLRVTLAIGMARRWLILLFSFTLALVGISVVSAEAAAGWAGRPVAQSDSATPIYILSPQADDVLQGKVAIHGHTAVDGLTTWMLEFGYKDDLTGTWFFILESEQPIDEGTLAEWDTTTITDGDYDLRLLVHQGEASSEFSIPVRVRNYTAVETNILEPTQVPAAMPESNVPGRNPTSTPTLIKIEPTLTILPTNPAEITLKDVTSSLRIGALFVLFFFTILAIYVYLRKVISR